jgi:hypothetical protein
MKQINVFSPKINEETIEEVVKTLKSGWLGNGPKVKEFEDKVKVAEQQSKEVNTVIEKKYIDRVKTVRETQYIMQEKIKEVEKLIDAECKVAPEAILILNQASITPKKESK